MSGHDSRPRKYRDFDKPDAAVERTVTTFVSAIDKLMVKCDPDEVARQYILEQMLLKLSKELSKRINWWHPMGDATLRLSNALADYGDSRLEDRG